jgi:hypothetical protein
MMKRTKEPIVFRKIKSIPHMTTYLTRFCLDCEILYQGQVCPICGSRQWYYLSHWIGIKDNSTRSEKEI